MLQNLLYKEEKVLKENDLTYWILNTRIKKGKMKAILVSLQEQKFETNWLMNMAQTFTDLHIIVVSSDVGIFYPKREKKVEVFQGYILFSKAVMLQ